MRLACARGVNYPLRAHRRCTYRERNSARARDTCITISSRRFRIGDTCAKQENCDLHVTRSLERHLRDAAEENSRFWSVTSTTLCSEHGVAGTITRYETVESGRDEGDAEKD